MNVENGEGLTAHPAGPRWALLGTALALWVWSTFAHAYGTDLARAYFDWAESPGNLTESGGLSGMHAGEQLLAAVLALLGVVTIGFAMRRLRGLDATMRRETVLRWAVWSAFLFLVWKTLIVFASELVHFGQYALISALLCAGLDRGRRPQLAFLVAVALGVLDEAWQHWGLAVWIQANPRHGFDWSDLILNATGACGGALLFLPGRGAPNEPRPLLRRTVTVLALLPLLLLEPAALAALFGSYTYEPFWSELGNGKPVHWMTPFDGIPLFLVALLFLGILLSPRRAHVSTGTSLALVLLVTLSIRPSSRIEGMPVHEVVPTAHAARVATGAIRIDGVLDEDAWAIAERIGPFVHSPSGAGEFPLANGGSVPLAPTHARMLWDDKAIYFAFDVSDTDVWGRDVPRDEPTLPGDEVVEVFIDPDGDELTYYEFEVSPLNVQYDLFNFVPRAPTDLNPSARFIGLADWDAEDVRSAVSVHGTLDRVESWDSAAPMDTDVGWTVEIAIPWRVFRTTTTPGTGTRVTLPPRIGDRWRLNLFRVERPRVSPVDGAPLGRHDASRLAQLQAWSAAHNDSFHQAWRFGIVEFID